MDRVMERIAEIGIVPVITLDSADKAAALGRALVAGGLPVAEIAFRTSAAGEAIRAMSAGAPDVLVGAGTVTSVRLAEEALSAGARFIVCPAWDEGVVDFCLERGLPVLPGTSGPDGVARAMAKGLEAVKLFPAEVLGGCAMLDALAGPFGSMRFVPTGGIDASNVGEYARRRQVLATGGSWMARSDLIESGDWAGVERLCREAVFALHGFGLAHVGVNGASAESAAADAASLASLFGFVLKDGASSIFMSDSIELLKSAYLGEKGHIAIRCNDVERALARFRGMGIKTIAGTERLERGRIKSVYLERSIGGFAVHLLRAT